MSGDGVFALANLGGIAPAAFNRRIHIKPMRRTAGGAKCLGHTKGNEIGNLQRHVVGNVAQRVGALITEACRIGCATNAH